MLKILHLMSARYFVGEAARVLDVVEAQIDRGHMARVLVRRKQTSAQEASHRGLPYIPAFFSSHFHPVRDYCDVRLIRRALDEHAIDIVHAHRGKDHWLAAWALKGYPRAVPLVRTRHVVMPIRNHLGNRWLYHRATAGIISVSQAVQEVVTRDLPRFPGPQEVNPGGVRLRRLQGATPEEAGELRERLHLPPDTNILTILARVARVKGHDHLVQALPTVVARHPRTVLVLAYPRFSPRFRHELEARIDRLRLREHIRWVGTLDRIGPLLAMTDIGLVTSVGSEGWSRVALEFLITGVPVVATTVGSLAEIVTHEETGLLVPPADPPALADALCRLLDDVSLRKRLGQTAATTTASCTHERMADQVLAFYDRVRARAGA